MPRIALVQFAPISPDSSDDAQQQNLEKAHEFVKSAKEQGAELVCFPEYFLTGVVADPQHWSLAQFPHSHRHLHDDHPKIPLLPVKTTTHFLSTFQHLAKELKIDIVVGTIVERQVDQESGKEVVKMVEADEEEEEVSGGGKNEEKKKMEERPVLNNVAHYIDWNGNVVGRYIKRNLWWPEKDYLTAGEEDHQVFETRFGRVGMLICWDLAHGESFLPLLEQKVDLIICPTYWTNSDGGEESKRWDGDSEKKWLESLVVSRAFENEAAMVFINVGSPQGTDPLDTKTNPEERIGCSQVCLPFRGKIGGTRSAEEELVVVDTDLSVLPDARAVYGMRRGLGDRKAARGEKLIEP